MAVSLPDEKCRSDVAERWVGLGGRSGLENGVRKFGGVDKFTILIVSIAKVIKCKYLSFMERSKMAG